MDFGFIIETFVETLKGVPVTLSLTVVALVLGGVSGLLLALIKLENVPILTPLINLFISISRATPMILQILIMYSLVPSLLNQLFIGLGLNFNIFEMNPVIYAYIIFTITATASLTELFRSAILTVDKGQMEAALASGLSRSQSFRRIVLPQSLTAALPNISNLTISLIKNTSLVFVMTVQDIFARARIQAAFGYNYIEAYTVIFFVYLILCAVIQYAFTHIEQNVGRYKNQHIVKGEN